MSSRSDPGIYLRGKPLQVPLLNPFSRLRGRAASSPVLPTLPAPALHADDTPVANGQATWQTETIAAGRSASTSSHLPISLSILPTSQSTRLLSTRNVARYSLHDAAISLCSPPNRLRGRTVSAPLSIPPTQASGLRHTSTPTMRPWAIHQTDNITSHRSASDTPRHLPSSPTPPIRRSLSVLSFRSAPGSPLHSIPASIITPCVQIPGRDVVADPCTPPINYSHLTVRNDIQKTESVTSSQRTPVSGLRSSPNSPSGPLIVTSRSESHAYVFLPDDSSLTSPNSVQV